MAYTWDANGKRLNDGSNTYLYGAGRVAQYAGATPSYFLPDGLGSVRQLADGAGSVTLAQRYDPFGADLSSAGAGSSVYGFTGEQSDASGLTYLRARYYAPGVGRFTARDTWEEDYFYPPSLNRWNYVGANPINKTDPSGLWWWGAGSTLLNSSENHLQNQNIHVRIQSVMMFGRMDQVHAEYPIPGTVAPMPIDLLDEITGELWEIKPWSQQAQGLEDLRVRLLAMNAAKQARLLNGTKPNGRSYFWNDAPKIWVPGFRFPAEIYIVTDATGHVHFYAGQTTPGLITWWTYHTRWPTTVPYPILLPDAVTWNPANKRKEWSPKPGMLPGYAYENIPGSSSPSESTPPNSVPDFSLPWWLYLLGIGPAGEYGVGGAGLGGGLYGNSDRLFCP